MSAATNRPAGLTQVPTGNGEPDLYRDVAGRAYWSDGSRVTSDDCEGIEAVDVLMPILARERLAVLDMADRRGRPRMGMGVNRDAADCELMAARVDL